MKRFGVFVLLIALLLSVREIYRAVFPPRVSAPFSKLPPQVQKERRIEAQNLVAQVEAVARDAKVADAPKVFVVQASEAQLNTLLQDRLRTEKFPISGLQIRLFNNILQVQGIAKYGGIDWPATISGTLQARNGALSYRIESLSVTGLPAPRKLRDKAQKAIESGLQKAFAGQNRARIDAVEITPGQLTIRGQTI